MFKTLKKRWSFFACFLLFVCSSALAENQIFQMRSNSLFNKLQIILDVESKPSFKAFSLPNPTRLVVDITNVVAAPTYRNNLSFKKRGVTVLRSSVRNKNEVRLVLELNRDYRWEVYSLPAENGEKPTLVIDVFDGEWPRRDFINRKVNSIGSNDKPINSAVGGTSQGVPAGQPSGFVLPEAKNSVTAKTPIQSQKTSTTTKQTKNTLPSQKSAVGAVATLPKAKDKTPSINVVPAKQSPKETTAKRLEQRTIVVVIDPGHGGKDSGAIGKYHTQEKDVVLKIAKRLKRKIDAIHGMKAILTRSSDRYISLRGRLRFARKHKADLFVSIHADAARKRTAKGSSVYILSNRGASSESARWLAKRENAVDLKYGVDIGDYEEDVGNFLMHFQQDATIESSNFLAQKTLSQLKRIGHLHKRHVERAGFAVLKSPDIPSMLVETAFISNPGEEKRLKSSRYQEKVANSIARGIRNYFKERLPQHLLLLGEGS